MKFRYLFVGAGATKPSIYITPNLTEVVRFVNDSFVVSCFNPTQGNLTWYKGGSEVTLSKGRISLSRAKSNGTSILSLVFTSLTHADKGDYTCTGAVNKTNEHITVRLIIQSPISFADTQSTQSLPENADGLVRCEVSGDPEVIVRWQVKGKTVTSDEDKKYKVLGDGLCVRNVTLSDSGLYVCRAIQVSTGLSLEHNITVTVSYKPKWLEPLGSGKTKVYGYIGGFANLSCQTLAEPPAEFVWRKDNVLIHGKNFANRTFYDETNKSVLRVYLNNRTALGAYNCKAKNKMGDINRTIYLEEGVKPGTPNETKIHSATHNSVKLHIQGPSWKEMEITSYRVQILEKSERDKGRGWEHSREVELHKDKPFIISDLKANTEYVMRVTSQNAAGPGDYGAEMKTKTLVSSATMLKINSNVILVAFTFLLINHFKC